MNEGSEPLPSPLSTQQHSDESVAGEVPAAFVARARSFLAGDYLPKIERCLEELTDTDVWWRAAEESNSIGNLILHLAGNARQWIVSGVGGAKDLRVRQREFDEREMMPRSELLALLRRTLAEVDDVLARLDGSLLMERRRIQGHDVTVLEAIFHVVEHFSMHTGQIILLTKMLTKKDLRFYDFSSGAPVADWHKKRSEGSNLSERMERARAQD
ncbi:MAG TPA: DinB family protein [Pyrinomonadaceae bacterium]